MARSFVPTADLQEGVFGWVRVGFFGFGFGFFLVFFCLFFFFQTKPFSYPLTGILAEASPLQVYVR